MEGRPVRVVMVDDHEMVLEGLKAMLARFAGRVRVVGQAASAEEAQPMVAALPSAKAILSTASSGDLNGREPGRCSVPVMYSLWCRISPSRASARAFSRVSAMCQLSSTRQSLRSTVEPCLAADASAKLHWVASAFSPSSDS